MVANAHLRLITSEFYIIPIPVIYSRLPGTHTLCPTFLPSRYNFIDIEKTFLFFLTTIPLIGFEHSGLKTKKSSI